MSDQRAWTPDQPLRADATDADIWLRGCRLSAVSSEGTPHLRSTAQAAREYAAACIAALPVPPAGTDEAVELWPVRYSADDDAMPLTREQVRDAMNSNGGWFEMGRQITPPGQMLNNVGAALLLGAGLEVQRRVVAALPVPREGPSHTCKECGGNLIRGDHHAACQNKARVTELTISGVTFRAVDDNHPPLCAPGKCKMESGVLPDRDVCSVCGIGSLPYPASRRMEQKAPQSVPREGEAGTAVLPFLRACAVNWDHDSSDPMHNASNSDCRACWAQRLVASLTASEGTSDA